MKQISIYNTLTGRKEPFQPIEPGKVRMYVCGITPYDECHLGHARCYVVFDTIRRFLAHAGYKVKYVQNFTDVDDKIINRAGELKEDPLALAGRFIDDYHFNMGLLNVMPADIYPRVTGHIDDIVSLIEMLVKRGHAYITETGDVCYAVDTFKEYGKLSRQKSNEMIAGARVEVDTSKRTPLDFALWKAAKPAEPSWDSPWGKGRPGWHIECSAMSMKHLGESLDIHGGGADLIFPHHENEIAQSEGATGKIFSRYWMHNGFVTINKEKMSKSLGNFFALRDIFKKYNPASVRLFLLSRHYKSPLDFSDAELDQCVKAWIDVCDTYELGHFVLWWRGRNGIHIPQFKDNNFTGENMALLKPVEDALSDDFNTEKVLAELFSLRTKMLEAVYEETKVEWFLTALGTYQYICETLLGLPLPKPVYKDGLPEMFVEKLRERESARKQKDWSRADSIRRELTAQGYYVDDTPLGPRLKQIEVRRQKSEDRSK